MHEMPLILLNSFMNSPGGRCFALQVTRYRRMKSFIENLEVLYVNR